MIKCGITGFKGNLGKTFLEVNNRFKYSKFKGDVSKKKQLENWLKNNKFNVIIHLAALVPTQKVNNNFKKALDVNYKGTKYLIDGIIKYQKDINWFFFASTSHVYPYQIKKITEKNKTKSISKYGETKLKAEGYILKRLKHSKFNFCIGRIFSIFDNKEKSFFAPSLVKKIQKGPKIMVLENLFHYRDFLSTKQISKIIFLLWKKNYSGIINIGSGKKTDLRKLAKFFGDKYKKKVLFKKNKPTYHVANISKLKKLGFQSKKLNFGSFF